MSSIEIPGYSILRELGKGGMATVYLAIQNNFEREVALKVMADALMENPAFSQRFLQEARIVSRLMHPNIVTVHDVGVHQGHHYLSMQYIDGDDLVVAQRYLNGAQIKQVIIDIAHALAYAGGKGYVHRDVKPENIMLHRDTGRAMLMDFGIARTLDVASSMTMTGTALGTPYYMSPEQARGRPVDTRADLYSLGVVAYFLLLGEVPYNAETPVAIGIKHITEPTPKLPSPLAKLQPLFNKMLAKEPADRFQNGQALAAQWQQLDDAVIDAWLTSRHTSQVAELSVATPARGTKAITNAQLIDDDLNDSAGFDQATTVMPAVAVGDNVLRADAADRVAAHKSKRTRYLPWILVSVLVGAAGYLYYAENARLHQSQPMQPDVPAAAVINALPEPVEPVALPAAGEQQLLAETQMPHAAVGGDVGAGLVELEPGIGENEVTGAEPAVAIAAQPEGSAAAIDAALAVKGADLVPAEFSGNEELSATQETSIVALSSSQPSPTELAFMAAQQAQEQALLTPDSQAQVLALYREVLQLAPGHAEAQTAVSALLQNFLQWADDALTSGELSLAKQWLSVWPRDIAQQADSARHQQMTQRLADVEAVAGYLQQAEQALREQRYSTPFEGSALANYQAVLSLDADNTKAQQGLDELASHYLKQAERLQLQERWDAALQQVTQGLRARPGHIQLLSLEQALQQQRTAQQQLAALGAQAVQAQQAGNLFSGTESAAAYYLAMLQVRADDTTARAGLAELNQQLAVGIEQFLLSHEYDRAEAMLAPALELIADDAQYRQLAQRIADARPVVNDLRVGAAPINDTADLSDGALIAGRTLYFALQFRNFYQPTTVLQAQLFDGARSVQIAAVPVIVSGADGVSRFRIDRPVAGFSEGGYHLDIIFAGERIASRAFTLIAAQP